MSTAQLLDPTDLYLFNSGTLEEAWRMLGANHCVHNGAAGVLFAVWAPNASKVALVHLVARLIRGGFQLLDCQFMTEHLRGFGAIEVSRAVFRGLLAEAIDRPATFQRELGGADPCAILQANTRRS